MRFCEPLLGIFALKKRHKINLQRYFCEYIGCFNALTLVNDNAFELSLMGCCISYLNIFHIAKPLVRSNFS